MPIISSVISRLTDVLSFPERVRLEQNCECALYLFNGQKVRDRAVQEGSLLRELAEVVRRRGKILHLPPLRERKEDILRIVYKSY